MRRGSACDGIAVLNTVPRAKGWSLGQEVRSRFAETGEQRLTVAAIFSDKQAAGLSYLLGLPAHDANFTDRLDGRVLVKRAEGVSLGAARAATARSIGHVCRCATGQRIPRSAKALLTTLAAAVP
jgi:hypothetical protein